MVAGKRAIFEGESVWARGKQRLCNKDEKELCPKPSRRSERIFSRALLDHVDVIICNRCGFSSGRSRGSLLLVSLDRLRRSILWRRVATPVILHLLVKFLLCLAGPAIRPTATFVLCIARAVVSSTTATTITSNRRALAGNVAIDVVRGRLGNITAAGTTTATAPGTIRGVTAGAQAACVASGAFNAVEQTVAGTFTATGNKRETNWLSFGVGTVEFVNRFVCVFEVGVCDECDAFRATGAVVDQREGGNGTNAAEQILRKP